MNAKEAKEITNKRIEEQVEILIEDLKKSIQCACKNAQSSAYKAYQCDLQSKHKRQIEKYFTDLGFTVKFSDHFDSLTISWQEK